MSPEGTTPLLKARLCSGTRGARLPTLGTRKDAQREEKVMATLILTADDDVLRGARLRMLKLGTSVDALERGCLREPA